tara:strand:- start:2389 stop:2682 length:294 start_codon:yes stop_codon:yes gene_type:complete
MNYSTLYTYDSEKICDVKVLKGRTVCDDGIDGRISITRMIAPTTMKGTNLARAIGNTFSYSYCQHEHDCCGCPRFNTYAKRVSAREYVVTTYTSYNI